MKTSLILLSAAGLSLAGLWMATAMSSADEPPARCAQRSRPAAGRRTAAIPPAFVENAGQWDARVLWMTRIDATTVFLERDGWVARFDGNDETAVIDMRLRGASPARPVGERRLPGVVGYYLGDDPARWRSGLARYARVRWCQPYEGVDVVAYENEGRFEYDLVLAPGSDLDEIEIEVGGASGLRIDDAGALVIETAAGPVRQPAPKTWETEASGERRLLACSYELRGARTFGFAAPGWRGTTTLTVDPGLVYSTYIGGSGDDRAHDMHVGATGLITIAGHTTSSNFPNASNNYVAGHDAFVAQLDPSKAGPRHLLWAAYVGGFGNDQAWGVSVDAGGVVTLVGNTTSRNFPTTANALQRSYAGGRYDAFVTRVHPTKGVLASTYVGSPGLDYADDVFVDSDPVHGYVAYGGSSDSSSYPTTAGAFQRTANGSWDGVVTLLDLQLSQLKYSTLVGGSGIDSGDEIAVDDNGWVTLIGHTRSADYPTTPGAYDRVLIGKGKMFVTRIDPNAATSSQLAASTFLAGDVNDWATGVHTQGVVTVVGESWSPTAPTTPGAFQRTFGGAADWYIAQLDARLTKLLYATFVGGAGQDGTAGVSVSPSGVIAVAGYVNGGFPTTPGAYQEVYAGQEWQMGVLRLDPARPASRQLLYSTFVGGTTHNDFATCIEVDPFGVATILGVTRSTDFPTTPDAGQRTYPGGTWNTVISRLDMIPAGTRTHGASSPGCTGELGIGANSTPKVANAGFALTCENAPASAAGVLVGGKALPSAVRVLGIDLLVEPVLVCAATSYASGTADVPVPIPNDPRLADLEVHFQFVWTGPTSPAPCPPLGYSASNVLEAKVQR